jgi:hypothetical protein
MLVLGKYDTARLKVLRPRDAKLIKRALVVFVVVLWLAYTLEQLARLRHARANPTTKQEVERYVGSEIGLFFLHKTRKKKKKKKKIVRNV